MKEAIKRRKPDFNETWYGFRAFGNLLEEAQARGLLEFGRDEKSGAYVYRNAGNTLQRAEAAPPPPPLLQAQQALSPATEQEPSDTSSKADEASERREPRRRSRGGRGRNAPAQVHGDAGITAPQAPAEPAREAPPEAAAPGADAAPIDVAGNAGSPKPRARRPRKPAVRPEG